MLSILWHGLDRVRICAILSKIKNTNVYLLEPKIRDEEHILPCDILNERKMFRIL